MTSTLISQYCRRPDNRNKLLGNSKYRKQPNCILSPNLGASANGLWQMLIAGSERSATAAGAQSAIGDPGGQYMHSTVPPQWRKWQEALCTDYGCKRPCMAAPQSLLEDSVLKRIKGDLRQPLVFLSCLQDALKTPALRLTYRHCFMRTVYISHAADGEDYMYDVSAVERWLQGVSQS